MSSSEDKHKRYHRRHRTERLAVMRTSYKENRDKRLEYAKRYAKELKQTVIDYYGGKCVCCGESTLDFLTLDHVESDGAAHRKQNGYRSGTSTYQWVVKNDFPDDVFQVLCWNCNCGRQVNGGICPHSTVD